jgi:peptide deformylase
MAVREIAHLGHPVLRQVASEVALAQIKTEAFQKFIDDLVETMRAANGAGLAAPQIYESVRVCALEVHKNPRYPYKPDIPLTILINPKIEILSDEVFDNYEGCLSVPNLRGMVKRHAHIRVTALDRHGEPISIETKGITAGTYQHEVDHLDALLFVDRVTDSKTLTTWTQFDEHYRDAWFETAKRIVDKYGS